MKKMCTYLTSSLSLIVRHVTVQLVFAATFAFSCMMFELIIFEILGYLLPSSRLFHWKLLLYSMLSVLIFLIPNYIGYFLVMNVHWIPKFLHRYEVLTRKFMISGNFHHIYFPDFFCVFCKDFRVFSTLSA